MFLKTKIEGRKEGRKEGGKSRNIHFYFLFLSMSYFVQISVLDCKIFDKCVLIKSTFSNR